MYTFSKGHKDWEYLKRVSASIVHGWNVYVLNKDVVCTLR